MAKKKTETNENEKAQKNTTKNKNLKSFGVEKKTLTHEQAVEFGRRGGEASSEARKKKKSFYAALEYVELQKATGAAKDMLDELGVEEDEQTIAMALAYRVVTEAFEGKPEFLEKYMEYVLKKEENERKNKESMARIGAMVNGDVDVTSGDDDDGGVHIYLPAIEEETTSEE